VGTPPKKLWEEAVSASGIRRPRPLVVWETTGNYFDWDDPDAKGKPNPNCPICRGSGRVRDNHRYLSAGHRPGSRVEYVVWESNVRNPVAAFAGTEDEIEIGNSDLSPEPAIWHQVLFNDDDPDEEGFGELEPVVRKLSHVRAGKRARDPRIRDRNEKIRALRHEGVEIDVLGAFFNLKTRQVREITEGVKVD
jgi:hypothetical protein